MTTNNIYIRTVDGIYVVDEIEVCDGYHDLYGFVVKESKHLDELFNRIVTVNKGHYKILTMYQYGKLSRNKVLKDLKKGITYYGACWTKTGLKYQAKMNDKGELELL